MLFSRSKLLAIRLYFASKWLSFSALSKGIVFNVKGCSSYSIAPKLLSIIGLKGKLKPTFVFF